MSRLPSWPGWSPNPEQKVWVGETDPEVTDDELAQLIEAAARTVTGKHTRRRDGTEVRTDPVGEHARRAVVQCVGGECHRAGLAYIWRTDYGYLYWARLIYPHDHNPVQRVLMVHPTLPGQVIHVPVVSRASHERRGWLPAPPGTLPPPRTYRQPQYAIDVRDLLDVDASAHPPLRAKCPRHGEVTLDRGRLRAELIRGRDTPGPYRIPLSAVV